MPVLLLLAAQTSIDIGEIPTRAEVILPLLPERSSRMPWQRLISTGLTIREIRPVIHRSFARLVSCYQKELELDRRAHPAMTIRFTVEPDGRTSNIAAVESNYRSEEARACLLEVFRTLMFPGPEGGRTVVVTYPFRPCTT